MSSKQNKSLKKKSSSLGVELQPLVDGNDDSTTCSHYGASLPNDGDFQQKQVGEYSLPRHTNETQVVPRAAQLMRPENLAIPACYLCVGLMQGEQPFKIL